MSGRADPGPGSVASFYAQPACAVWGRGNMIVAPACQRDDLPNLYGHLAAFAEAGCIASYGPNLRDGYRRLAHYADRILKGASPSSLPVELPARLETVINLKTARALGITIPHSVLLRADEVIQ